MNDETLAVGIDQVQSTRVETVEATESILGVVQRMRWNNAGTLIVVDEDRIPRGILTDRDVAIRVIGGGRSPSETVVSDVMTSDPAVLDQAATVRDGLDLMAERGVRRLPVVDGGGALVAIVTLDDVVRSLCADIAQVCKILRWASPLPPCLDL